ncbi:alpha/beta hydrolase [Segnochrobactrum spirostomi]|uniref:Phospholipase n=1 Tax=Segnochrobactrum spirostomi TaxID=2608987 RepID=A0A6A7YDU6_9HYPH|nr:dienelactone hydrolase family protein [Segnochrobactrum spirostomi]MQT15599.1 phospholipase [Segnochrobactrum spirostomi]
MTGLSGPMRLGPRAPAARAVCVLVHGRGQSPEEMQSHVLARLTAPAVAFMLPRAPEGAWWTARAVDPLTSITRAELATALDHLAAAMAAARGELPGVPLVLAGFSQGACLAIEYLSAGLPAPDVLVAFTGCRVGVEADNRREAAPAGVPVYLTGGDADPWIPLSAFTDAAQSLGRQRANVRADLFPGRPHEVSAAEIAMLSSILGDCAAGRSPRMEAPR